MFDRWGRLCPRWRWWILGLASAVALGAGAWGAGIFRVATGSGFGDPSSEAGRAAASAAAHFAEVRADVALVYTSSLAVDDPRYRQAVQSAIRNLPDQSVLAVTDYWTTRSPGLVSPDRRSTLVVLALVGSDEEARSAAYAAVADQLGHPPPGFSVQRGGSAAVFHDVSRRAEKDIKRAETVSFPLLLILLTVLFGGLVAASLPLVVGAASIVGAFAVLRCLTVVTHVSVFTINIVTLLGLGLAIDYALFMVSRFREEMARSAAIDAAVHRTVVTAGRAIAFSGITVALALASLLVYPQAYFRSMALGGMAAAGIAVLVSLTALPALLAVVGSHIRSRRIILWRPKQKRQPRHRTPVLGMFHRLARRVMRRPYSVVLVVVTALLALTWPTMHATFGDFDASVLPVTTESRVVAEQLGAEFRQVAEDPIRAIVSFPAGTTRGQSAAALRPYLNRLRALPQVESATLRANAGSTALVSLVAKGKSAARARPAVSQVRATTPPDHGTVLVGGSAADLADLLATLRSGLPWLALTVLGVTFVALFLAFGSLVLPVKAIGLSVLSLAASYGAIILIFQDGHLSGVLGFTATGAVEPTQLVLLAVVAFALSTDYEIFLLSRIREEWDATGDNELAVANGVQGSAPVISSAALMLLVVIGCFSASGISFLKMIGVGMVIAIVLDATVVRMLLVPATMCLLGPGNWWAPGPLARWWRNHRPHGAHN